MMVFNVIILGTRGLRKYVYSRALIPAKRSGLRVRGSCYQMPGGVNEAVVCPHVSFDQDNASCNAKPRESIEIRALVFTFPKG